MDAEGNIRRFADEAELKQFEAKKGEKLTELTEKEAEALEKAPEEDRHNILATMRNASLLDSISNMLGNGGTPRKRNGEYTRPKFDKKKVRAKNKQARKMRKANKRK